MCERNTLVETKSETKARAEKSGEFLIQLRQKERYISANLSAGMLENNRMKHPKGAVDFLISATAHSLLLAVAILVPLYFTDAIDIHNLETTYLVAPVPPPPPPPPPAGNLRILRHRSLLTNAKLYAPRVIPKHIAEVRDLSDAPQITSGVPGGVPGGIPGGQLGGVIGGILGEIGDVVPPPPMPKPSAHRGPYRVGGKVQPPKLVHEVQPGYPILAKEVHLQGAVVIDSVIDAQGNVTQMKLVSGPPLLVTAAFDAVRQWKYQPTLLNGEPVAVEMQVTVHFTLAS